MKAMLNFAVSAVCLVLAGSAVAQNKAEEAINANYEGTLGSSRIGMTLIIQNGQLVSPSHYFYQKYLTDIPLTGGAGVPLVLHEPGGGAFSLKFKGNGSNGSQPLTFENSVGLEGTWTSKDGKSYPVTLSGGGGPGEPETGRRYKNITDESDAAFEAKAQGFYKAVMAADKAGAARYTNFPLRVNFGPSKHLLIKNTAQLFAQWDTIFTPAWLKKMANAMPHDMAVIQGMAMLGDGLVYFSDKGAEVINAAN